MTCSWAGVPGDWGCLSSTQAACSRSVSWSVVTDGYKFSSFVI